MLTHEPVVLAHVALSAFLTAGLIASAAVQDDGPMSAAEADPEVPKGVLVHTDAAFDGYTLFAPLNSKSVHLMDMAGELVHSWECDTSPAGGTYLLDDGTLLRCGREDAEPRFRGGGIGGHIQQLAPDGSLVWSYRLADDDRCQHHDIEALPNGNVLAIAWERVSAADAIARGRDPLEVGKAGFWPDAVFEIRPTPPAGGEIVWEWHAWDHLVQDHDPDLVGYGAIPGNYRRLDINADHRDAPPLTAEELHELAELEKAMRSIGYIGGGDEDEEEDLPDDSRERIGHRKGPTPRILCNPGHG